MMLSRRQAFTLGAAIISLGASHTLDDRFSSPSRATSIPSPLKSTSNNETLTFYYSATRDIQPAEIASSLSVTARVMIPSSSNRQDLLQSSRRQPRARNTSPPITTVSYNTILLRICRPTIPPSVVRQPPHTITLPPSIHLCKPSLQPTIHTHKQSLVWFTLLLKPSSSSHLIIINKSWTSVTTHPGL